MGEISLTTRWSRSPLRDRRPGRVGPSAAVENEPSGMRHLAHPGPGRRRNVIELTQDGTLPWSAALA